MSRAQRREGLVRRRNVDACWLEVHDYDHDDNPSDGADDESLTKPDYDDQGIDDHGRGPDGASPDEGTGHGRRIR